MTNLKKIMFFALFLGAFVLYSTSCNKSDEILEEVVENDIQHAIQAPTSENGWLHFEDDAAMDAAFVELIENFNEVEAWEAKYNHNSLRSRYEAAMEHIDAAEGMGTNPGQLLQQYSDVLQVIGEGDERQTVCIVDDIIMSALLNEDGIIQVGQQISKYSNDKLKIITDGDISKLDMLDRIDETNEALGIEVINLNDESERGIRCWTTFNHRERTIYVRQTGRWLRVRFRVSFYRSNQSYRVYMVHEMRGQKKKAATGWGNSNYSYEFGIESDYHITANDTGFPTPPIVADSDFTINWTNGYGQVTSSRFLYEMVALGDLDVWFDQEFKARKDISGTSNVPSGSGYDIWNIECYSVWYPWND